MKDKIKREERKERREKKGREEEREREKVIGRAGYCNLKASRCFRILPRTRRFISTHRVLLPSHFSTPWGYLPGGINNRRGSARGVQWQSRESQDCGVEGGTRSSGAWLRLRHATSTRPSSPSSYLVSPRFTSSRLVASPPPFVWPPPLTRILCFP